MYRFIRFIALLIAAAGAASLPARAQAPPPVTASGSITPAVQQFDNSDDSSKLTEYRDLRDNFYVPDVKFSLFGTRKGGFLDFFGTKVSRDDQTILAEGGRLGIWSLRLDWAEIPHNLSNKAQTPYLQRGPGLFEVPATVPITFKKLATGAADAPQVLASDNLIAAFQNRFLHPVDLATQSRFGRLGLEYAGFKNLKLGVAYDRRTKSGLKPTFGPIGDRPPRTLNIQFTEPVDYRTGDLTVSAEHQGRFFDLQFEYLFSDFSNRVDTLVWQNIYTTAEPGATFDRWDRALSVFGRRPLPPDNRYHRASVGIKRELPRQSLLSATFAFGRMEQNETLLPYSFHSDLLVNKTLPRETAQAEINTTQLLVDYVINPAARLNLRAWVRHYGLDNNTPAGNFQYVTSDTSNLNGTVAYKNKRISQAYASDRTNGGVEATYRLAPWRSTLRLGYELEDVERDFREADTTEHRLVASVRTRPAGWANLRARYTLGERDGGTYNGLVTRQSYWYTLEDVTDNDNPRFAFSNHPDMIRFDVSDRRRNQFDLTLNLTPRDIVSLSGTLRYRNDDFDSDVRPSQPLVGDSRSTEPNAASPGQQLGLLERSRLGYSLDVFSMPAERVTLNAFLSWDRGRQLQRGLEFQENNKENPSRLAALELGPWTRASSQWMADYEDRTWTVGFGATLGLVPDRVNLNANYSASLADVEIEYSGFGVTNFEGTPFPPNHPFAFRTPPTIKENLHVLDLRLEIPVSRTVLLLGYTFERYRLGDWQQGSRFPWVEPVGSEFLLRDTSRSHQWGNRLFNLGSELAPDYDTHIAYLAFRYRF